MTQRNSRTANNPESAIPTNILESHDVDAVCRAMRLFVLEVRRVGGQRYTPATIQSLLSGLNHELQRAKAPFLLMDKNDRCLRELHLTLDSVSSDLHRDGVGAVRQCASVISFEDENLFWQKGSLGHSSPVCIQHTVFFYMGMHFVLWGLQKQHYLVPQQ